MDSSSDVVDRRRWAGRRGIVGRRGRPLGWVAMIASEEVWERVYAGGWPGERSGDLVGDSGGIKESACCEDCCDEAGRLERCVEKRLRRTWAGGAATVGFAYGVGDGE